MKITDDYRAKLRLWARLPRVVSLPPMPPLPKFTARKFRNHEEMNQWKQSLMREVAQTIAFHG